MQAAATNPPSGAVVPAQAPVSATPHRLQLSGRVVCIVVATMCLAVIVTAFLLEPASKGHATHTQLGLPACGWATFFDKPCPTCGMTTSFALAAKGRFWTAFRTQPAGFLIALGTCATFWAALHGAVFASRVDRLLLPLLTPRWLWTFAGILLAAWAYKMLTWH